MTKIKSELLLASKNKANGIILYSWRLTFPRIILAENLTHRVLSRNTSSTRAIPTIKMIKAVWSDMFVPTYIGSAQKGMQSGAELAGWRRSLAVAAWKTAGYAACAFAYILTKLGVAKQIAGRVIEPWSWVTQILSTTEVDNFFNLRVSPMAEPHLCELATQMQSQVDVTNLLFKTMQGKRQSQDESHDNSTPLCMQWLEPGEWHLPLLKPHEWMSAREGKMVSAARCARTSYTLIETGKETSIENDIELCKKLLGGQHLSPFEHQAQAIDSDEFSGNFRAFKQFRKEIETNG